MAVRFDASSDQITRTASAPTIGSTGFTFVAWIYLSVDRNDFSTWFRIRDAGGTVGTFASDGGGQTISYFTVSGSITSSTVMAVGNWYRVAISIPSTGGSTATGTLYTADATGATSSASGTVAADNDATIITIGGRGGGDSSEWWNGRVAYARIWQAALSQAEVEAEWASPTPVRASGLWADYPLTVHTDLTDHSGNGRDLTAGSTAVTTEDDPPVGSGATVTPSAVATTTTAPAPTVSAGSTSSPAAVATAGTLPAPSLSAGVTVSPAAIGTVTVLPAPSLAAGATAAPAVVETVTTAPAASLAAGSTVAPAGVQTVTSAPAASVSAGSTAAPAAVLTVAQVPGGVVFDGTIVAPAAIATTAAIPSASVSVGSRVSPTAIITRVFMPAAVASDGSTPTVEPAQGSWYSLVSVLREARQIMLDDQLAIEAACPNCGEPLRYARGERYCPFDGYRAGR